MRWALSLDRITTTHPLCIPTPDACGAHETQEIQRERQLQFCSTMGFFLLDQCNRFLDLPERGTARVKHDDTASTPHYQKQGSYDVGPCETTPFWWAKTQKMMLVEGICFGRDFDPVSGYWGHAGLWDTRYFGHSYFRIRELESGVVVTNITSSIGFGFPAGFVDFDHGML